MSEKVDKLFSEKASIVSMKRIEDKLWFETPSNEKFELAVEDIHKKIDADVDTLKTFTKKIERFRLDQTRANDRKEKADIELQEEIHTMQSKAERAKKDLSELQNTVYQLENKFAQAEIKYQLKEDSDALKERFDKFSDIEHIDQL